MNVLILSYRMPFDLKDGGAYSVHHSARTILRAGHSVKMLAINSTRQWVDAEQYDEDFVLATRLEVVRVDTRIRLTGALRSLFQKDSYFTTRFDSDSFRHKLIEVLSAEVFDLVQLEHIAMGCYIDTIRQYSSSEIILRPQNVEHALLQERGSAAGNIFKRLYLELQSRKLYRYEMLVANQVDAIAALTKEDEDFFRCMARMTQTGVIPLPYAEQLETVPRRHKSPPSFYHIGSMDWWPNPEGVSWFLKHVWPRICGVHKQICFHFAGKKMPSALSARLPQNVFCDGEVNDATDYHQNHDVLIVPLLSGSGIRLKIIEAMAMGKTVISTSIGAAGIGAVPGTQIIIANDAAAMANAIIACFYSPELSRRTGENARQFAHSHFSPAMISQKWNEFAHKVLNGNSREERPLQVRA